MLFSIGKIEKILKGSLDSIASPSRIPEHLNFLFHFFGKILLGVVNKPFLDKKFVDNTQKCFAFTPQANLTAHNLNFH